MEVKGSIDLSDSIENIDGLVDAKPDGLVDAKPEWLINFKFDVRKHGKQCINPDCGSFILCKRDDAHASKVKIYRKHIGNMSHPQWIPLIEKELGLHHEKLCDLGYKCPYLCCMKDGDKDHIDILEHLWQFRHKRNRQKN